MAYEKIFEKPYPGGWKNRPDTSTLVTAQILDSYDEAFEHIEDHLDGTSAIFPITATGGMTQPVGLDENGRLVTMPSSGGGTAANTSYDNTESELDAENVQDAIDEIASDFQDGCDILVQAVTAKGQTPASNSPADIAEAISNISGGTFTTRTFTINGTYSALDDNVDGYSQVTVNVPSSGNVIFSADTPDPTIGENGQYYYKCTDEGQIIFNNGVLSTGSTNSLIHGNEFIANLDLTITKLRGKVNANKTGSLRIGDLSSILGTINNLTFTSGQWVEADLETPVQIAAGTHFIVQAVVSGSTPGSIAYGSLSTSPSINTKYASYVTGRYGGYPGTTEGGYYVNVDIVFNEGILTTLNQYIKKNGVWVEI